MELIKIITILSFLCLGATESLGSQVAADEVMKRSQHAMYYPANNSQCDVSLKMLDKRGKKHEWDFEMFREDAARYPEQKTFVIFYNPSAMRNIAYMTWKHADEGVERWIYFPKQNYYEQIEPAHANSSFMGAYLTHEDISGRPVSADRHELFEINGDHYIIKNIPKDPATADFKYYYVYIRQGDYLPTKVEFYDQNDLLMKLVEVLGVENIQGYNTVTKTLIKDLKRGGEAIMEFTNVQYNQNFDNNLRIENGGRRLPTIQY